MIRQTLKIINKNLKLLLRSRSSALIFILGPLLLIMLVGFAFNSIGTRNMDIGIYSESYSEVTLSFVKEIADGPFRTLQFKSEETCIENIKKGTVTACVIFPPDLDITDTNIEEIMFYVDYSKLNVVWQVMDRIKKQLTKASDSFSLDLTNVLLTSLDTVQDHANKTYPIISDSRSRSDLLVSQIKQSSGSMDGIDLDLDMSSLDFDDVKLEIGTLKHSVAAMYDGLDKMYKKAKDLNNYGLSQALLCTATPEEETSLRAKLDFNQVGVFKSDIDDDYSSALSKLNYSYNKVADIEKEINDLDRRLSSGESLRDELQSNLSKTITLVDVNNQNLALIKNRIAKIESVIDGLEVKDAENIVTPISTNIKPVIAEKTNLMSLFPNLVTLVTLFMCVLLAATIVVTEKKSTAYFRNFISPSSDFNFIIASYLTNLLLMLMQVGVILFIANYYFQTHVSANLFAISLILFLLITLFTLIGMFVGFIMNSQDTVTIGAIVVSSIMLFMSDMIMPLESMPAYISNIASYNPFIIGSDLLKKAILFQKPAGELSSDITLLIVYSVMMFLIVMLIQWLIKKQKIGKYANRYVMKKERKKWHRLVAFSEDVEKELDG